ncbi:MAG: metalloregulator ArsR/SmtB family transcription factor [Erysipelotrichaceae bacterium]
MKPYECETIEIHQDKIDKIKKDMLPQMQFNDLSSLFKMFSDPTRLKILSVLFQEELCVCDIAALLEMSHSAISHQLSVLRANRIIKYRKVGKNVYYALNDEHIELIYNAGLSHILEEHK